jgi:hypothetical protein
MGSSAAVRTVVTCPLRSSATAPTNAATQAAATRIDEMATRGRTGSVAAAAASPPSARAVNTSAIVTVRSGPGAPR